MATKSNNNVNIFNKKAANDVKKLYNESIKGFNATVRHLYTLSATNDGVKLLCSYLGIDAQSVKSSANIQALRNDIMAKLPIYTLNEKHNITPAKLKVIDSYVATKCYIAVPCSYLDALLTLAVKLSNQATNSKVYTQVKVTLTSACTLNDDDIYTLDNVDFKPYTANGEVYSNNAAIVDDMKSRYVKVLNAKRSTNIAARSYRASVYNEELNN